MAFGGSKQQNQQSGEQTQSAYLNMSEGDRVVRLLDEDETTYWAYWLNGAAWANCGKGKSIVVGRDGPLKRHFEALGQDHPDYRKVGKKYLVNVMDRTPVKKTSRGLPVYANPAGVFPSDVNGENISAQPVVPNNTVYVMNYGPQICDWFSMLHKKVNKRETLRPLSLWEFDVKITRKGSGFNNTNYFVFPADDQNELPDELLALSKYDLSQFTRPFPNEAQERLIKGDDYAAIMKDIGWDRPVPTIPLLPF